MPRGPLADFQGESQHPAHPADPSFVIMNGDGYQMYRFVGHHL